MEFSEIQPWLVFFKDIALIVVAVVVVSYLNSWRQQLYNSRKIKLVEETLILLYQFENKYQAIVNSYQSIKESMNADSVEQKSYIDLMWYFATTIKKIPTEFESLQSKIKQCQIEYRVVFNQKNKSPLVIISNMIDDLQKASSRFQIAKPAKPLKFDNDYYERNKKNALLFNQQDAFYFDLAIDQHAPFAAQATHAIEMMEKRLEELTLESYGLVS